MKTLEYLEIHLSTILKTFKEEALKRKDWEIIAVDPVKDKVIFRRLSDE